MKTRIFTFSGTGNSLWAAKALKDRIDDCVLSPIAGWLRHGLDEAHEPAIGFVFPVHAFTLPPLVKRFARRIKLPNAEYLFAVQALPLARKEPIPLQSNKTSNRGRGIAT